MVVRRTSTGASLPGEDPTERGVFSSLKRVDMYKRVPSDILTGEGTLAGGVLTIGTACAFAALLFLQITSLFTTTLRTDIVVDHTSGDGNAFQVNVQIDFPFVSCDWLSMSVTDVLGARDFNISGENVYKHPMHGPLKWMGIEHAAPTVVASREHEYGVSTDFDHYGNKQISYEIVGEDVFERMVGVHKNGALLVNFHAPWCAHCRKFAPIFEHAAEMVRADARRQGKSRLSCGLATVDCTLAENEALCDKLRIQAYPTVRVYRAGRLHPSKTSRVSVDDMHAEKESFQFEMYHGPRTAEALAAFTMSLLKEIEANEGDVGDDANGDEPHATRKRVILGHDFDGDGLHDSKITTPGCSINGSFRISKVPGAFYFVPRSKAHTIADADMTHVIRHLSFGSHVPGRPSYVPRHLRRAYAIIPSDMGGRFAAKNAALTEFVAAEERTVFEHYMKVIPRKYVPLDEGDAMRVYEYTFNSNQFSVEKTRQKDMFELYEPVDDVGLPEGPMVKFAYDISGMEVITREHRKNFLEWVLGCCAILGGVYTCAAIAESVVFASAKHLVKRRLRKQS